MVGLNSNIQLAIENNIPKDAILRTAIFAVGISKQVGDHNCLANEDFLWELRSQLVGKHLVMSPNGFDAHPEPDNLEPVKLGTITGAEVEDGKCYIVYSIDDAFNEIANKLQNRALALSVAMWTDEAKLADSIYNGIDYGELYLMTKPNVVNVCVVSNPNITLDYSTLKLNSSRTTMPCKTNAEADSAKKIKEAEQAIKDAEQAKKEAEAVLEACKVKTNASGEDDVDATLAEAEKAKKEAEAVIEKCKAIKMKGNSADGESGSVDTDVAVDVALDKEVLARVDAIEAKLDAFIQAQTAQPTLKTNSLRALTNNKPRASSYSQSDNQVSADALDTMSPHAKRFLNEIL